MSYLIHGQWKHTNFFYENLLATDEVMNIILQNSLVLKMMSMIFSWDFNKPEFHSAGSNSHPWFMSSLLKTLQSLNVSRYPL